MKTSSRRQLVPGATARERILMSSTHGPQKRRLSRTTNPKPQSAPPRAVRRRMVLMRTGSMEPDVANLAFQARAPLVTVLVTKHRCSPRSSRTSWTKLNGHPAHVVRFDRGASTQSASFNRFDSDTVHQRKSGETRWILAKYRAQQFALGGASCAESRLVSTW
jgi:hypothetical protein